MIRMRWLALAAVALILSGCDSGPSGPGTLQALVTGTPVAGAVVIEVTGTGIQGFEGQAGTTAYGALVQAAAGVHRVVVVAPAGGALRFGIRVDDLGMDLPVATVRQATSMQSIPALSSGLAVQITKPE